MNHKKKKKDMFILMAHHTPFVGEPEDQDCDNNLPDLPISLRAAQKLKKVWEAYDMNMSTDQDSPPQEFHIYKLELVE